MAFVRPALVLILVTICAIAQSTNNAANTKKCDATFATLCWPRIVAGPFAISAPPGWKFRQLNGVDSFVGEFVGDDVVLTFDFGRYSTELRKARKPAYVITKKSIGGYAAKVVIPWTPGNGLTGVYIRAKGHDALCLWGKNLTSTEQELALEIFETIRFRGGPMPPTVIPPSPPPPATKD